ncbi:hypothetical protein, partial [Microseira wollei]|uniref:hypothetical protein n=1 Tax=Microseira wollei TaxID=467598 RepID=UPI001CFD74C5
KIYSTPCPLGIYTSCIDTAFSNLWYKPKFILRRAPWAFIQVVGARHFPTFGINQNLFYAVPPGHLYKL